MTALIHLIVHGKIYVCGGGPIKYRGSNTVSTSHKCNSHFTMTTHYVVTIEIRRYGIFFNSTFHSFLINNIVVYFIYIKLI